MANYTVTCTEPLQNGAKRLRVVFSVEIDPNAKPGETHLVWEQAVELAAGADQYAAITAAYEGCLVMVNSHKNKAAPPAPEAVEI